MFCFVFSGRKVFAYSHLELAIRWNYQAHRQTSQISMTSMWHMMRCTKIWWEKILICIPSWSTTTWFFFYKVIKLQTLIQTSWWDLETYSFTLYRLLKNTYVLKFSQCGVYGFVSLLGMSLKISFLNWEELDLEVHIFKVCVFKLVRILSICCLILWVLPPTFNPITLTLYLSFTSSFLLVLIK